MAFKTNTDEDSKRLVVAVWGEPKVGKTHFALTAPEPVRFLNLDFGLRDLLPKFRARDIAWSDIETTDPRNVDESRRLLDEFNKDYLAAVAECSKAGGTVVVDTATQLWQMIQTVKLHEVRTRRGAAKGKSADEVKPMGFDYAECNSLMDSFLRRPLHQAKCNAVFIHRAKLKYTEGGERTNQMEFQGYSNTPSLAQVTLQITGKGKGRIDYCRADSDMAGMPLDDLDFALLRDLYYASTEGE